MVRSVLVVFAVLIGMANVADADQTTDANIASCKRFFAEISKGNLKIIDEMVLENFVEHEEFPDMPKGRPGLHKFFKDMRTAFPDLKMEPEFFVASGDMVTCYTTMSGTHKGPFMGMPATGKKVDIKVVDIVRLVDGKAVEHWGVSDMMGMMQQLGMMGDEDHEGYGEDND
jgi:steroid delta-isomerase-like uncharacterized protein